MSLVTRQIRKYYRKIVDDYAGMGTKPDVAPHGDRGRRPPWFTMASIAGMWAGGRLRDSGMIDGVGVTKPVPGVCIHPNISQIIFLIASLDMRP